jgi:hypothetical protein
MIIYPQLWSESLDMLSGVDVLHQDLHGERALNVMTPCIPSSAWGLALSMMITDGRAGGGVQRVRACDVYETNEGCGTCEVACSVCVMYMKQMMGVVGADGLAHVDRIGRCRLNLLTTTQ